MRLRNQMAIVVSLVTFIFICWNAVVAQQTYPSTGQDAFVPSTNAFPVSPPRHLDQQTGPDSEMSPDHWGSTANLDGEDSYLSANTAQPWDGEIESHPWLQQDEMAGFEPSNFPELKTNAFPVSSDPETQSEIPLPPSSTNSTDIPLPPSSSSSHPGNFEPRLYPQPTGSAQPPLGTNPSFNAKPPYASGSSVIREPSFDNSPAKNSEPEFNSEPSVDINSPVFSNPPSQPGNPPYNSDQPMDSPPLPAMPSSKVSNDFQQRNVNPRTVDYPDGEYRSEIEGSTDDGSSNTDVGSTAIPNSTPGTPPVYGNNISSPYEKIDSRRNIISGRSDRVFGQKSQEEVNGNNPTNGGRPIVGKPQRYPFSNLVGNGQPGQRQVGQSPGVPTPVVTNPSAGTAAAQPKFRPDLGFRSQAPVNRGMFPEDQGQRFDFDEEHYPSMREILKTGRYFGSIEALLVKPHFQGNTSVAQSDGLTQAFDFDWAFAPKLQLGFESQLGPGGELVYADYDQNSDPTVFTSDGVVSGTTRVFLPGQNAWSELTASNAGEMLVSEQSLGFQQFSASMFKDLKFRRAKLNGIFGLQYVGIHQELSSYLLDSGGATIGSLSNRTDKHFFGPRVAFEYYRKIGHTGLVLANNFGGAVLFGNSDQYVDNGGFNVSAISGADELLTILNVGFGIQKHRRIGETRSVFWKIGYDGQSWLGGGNASSSQPNFGVRGYSFAIGFNR